MCKSIQEWTKLELFFFPCIIHKLWHKKTQLALLLIGTIPQSKICNLIVPSQNCIISHHIFSQEEELSLAQEEVKKLLSNVDEENKLQFKLRQEIRAEIRQVQTVSPE